MGKHCSEKLRNHYYTLNFQLISPCLTELQENWGSERSGILWAVFDTVITFSDRHQVLLSDLLTAPPHLPAQPLHLLQLHDGEQKRRHNAQSSCCCFPQLSLWSSSPFWFCPAPNSVWQAYNPQDSLTPAVHHLKTNPVFFPPLFRVWFLKKSFFF